MFIKKLRRRHILDFLIFKTQNEGDFWAEFSKKCANLGWFLVIFSS